MKSAEKRRSLKLIFGLVLCAMVNAGCRDKAAPPPTGENSGPERSTSEMITEADKFYRQRTDLANVRRGDHRSAPGYDQRSGELRGRLETGKTRIFPRFAFKG